MAEHRDVHTQAALRHEQAAENHDRAATFWDQQGKRRRAGLQRELADYERQGAELERRWARLVEQGLAEDSPGTVASTRRVMRKNAEHLSSELDRTGEALEKAATIADQRALRREEVGRTDGAGEERRVADRARTYAQRAHVQAEEWRRLASSITRAS